MNTIPQDQSAERSLERLAAQRQLYSDAKRVQAVHMVFSVPIVVGWSLLVIAVPDAKVYAATWGIVVAVFDVILFTPWQKTLKQKAAKIQELFDCDVMRLAWQEIKVGRRPEPETVKLAAQRYKKAEPDYVTLKNWYPPEVGQLPIELARIICQRINCWWDADLRRRYAATIISIVAMLALVVFLLALIGGLTVEKLVLAVLVPLLPAFILGIRQFSEHRDSAAKADRLRHHAEDLWAKAMLGEANPDELTKCARDLQDEIHSNRCISPLIFDWVFRRLRAGKEDVANKSASELVAEALSKK